MHLGVLKAAEVEINERALGCVARRILLQNSTLTTPDNHRRLIHRLLMKMFQIHLRF